MRSDRGKFIIPSKRDPCPGLWVWLVGFTLLGRRRRHRTAKHRFHITASDRPTDQIAECG